MDLASTHIICVTAPLCISARLSIVNHEAADIPKKLGRSNTMSGGDDANTGEDMESPRMKARKTKFDQNVTVN